MVALPIAIPGVKSIAIVRLTLISLSTSLGGCVIGDIFAGAFSNAAAICARDDFTVVTTALDISNRFYCDGTHQCTLRRALRTANFCSYDGVKTVRFDLRPGEDTFVLRVAPSDDPLVSELHRLHAGDVGLPRITGRVIVEGGGITIEREAGAPPFRLLHIVPDASLTLRNITLRNGLASDPSPDSRETNYGGAIYNQGETTIEDSSITQSEAPAGGAIYNRGTLTVSRSELNENRGNRGSAIFNNHGAIARISQSRFSRNENDWGALATEGTFELDQSTVDGNVGVYAGGLWIGSQDTASSVTRIINSTFSANTGQTGAIWCDDPGAASGDLLELRDVTVTRNRAADAGWTDWATVGGISLACDDVRVSNTIVANNTPRDCDGRRLVIGSISMDSDSTCAGFTLHADPALGALRNNGGLTPTHLPNPGSPVINAGSACEAVDQRGEFRPDLGCDIGSVQLPVIPPF